MMKAMRVLGFGVGVFLGLAVRDNFMYSMSEKMDDIATDYTNMNQKL